MRPRSGRAPAVILHGRKYWIGDGIASPSRPGGVTQFTDIATDLKANGSIASNAFNYPFGCAFRGNELFVLNQDGNNILRFIVKGDGTIVPNGAIPDPQGGDHADRGITVSP